MYEEQELDAPLSQSSVSLKLSLIQKRCTELLDDTDGLGLALEEPEFSHGASDPYNNG